MRVWHMTKQYATAASLLAALVGSVWADTVVVFNEIMYHPATNEPGMEWVELRNQMAVDVDISGWSLGGAIQYTFPSNSIVPGGGFVLVALSPETLSRVLGTTNLFGPFTGRLGNNGDTLELRDKSGRLMDTVTYGVEGDWPVAPDGSGVSLAKLDRDGPSNRPDNWRASEQIGGTPGADNFPFYQSKAPDLPLVLIDSFWKYHDGGQDLGTTWRQLGFDDNAWAARFNISNSPIPTLFNTGIGADGRPLAVGARDPNYRIIAAAQGPVNTNAVVMANHPNWLPNDNASMWIGITSSGSDNVAAGNYDYRTSFVLDRFLLPTVRVNLTVAVDNDLTAVLLNGVSTGITYSGFGSWSGPFTLSSGFVLGTNTLDFRTVNAGTSANPHGFRLLLSGSGLVVSTNPPLAAGRPTYYFRRAFVLDRDPAYTALTLRAVVADGAVFYLNGVEVYRQNMPAGPISYSTPALADVPAPNYSSPVSLPTGSLLRGTNVLAVEVHQATGGTEGAVLGVELLATPLPIPEPSLAFNEVLGSTNTGFWLELINYGTNELLLDGWRIVHDAASDHSYVFPNQGNLLAPGALVTVTADTLGFTPDSGDKLYLVSPGGDRVCDGVVVKKRTRARWPDGTGRWLNPAWPSPGASNVFAFHDEIVINEIMYHPPLRFETNGGPPQAWPESWVELYNRSSNTVDLTGWTLEGGIRYNFSPGQTIPPGGYLVVAEEATFLRTLYPGVPVVGNFAGRLSRRGERLVLRDASGNPADEVCYYDRGHWPEYADGGGSSLELRDPFADNSAAQAWAASDESGKTTWQTYSYRMVATIPSGSGQPTVWNDFIFGLLGPGECLIDDLNVIESPSTSPVAIIANGNFENGLTGWRVLGNHGRSRVEPDPDNPGNHVLHLIASGPQEHMHNHIETTLVGGRTIVNGREYEISYRARWLAGNNLLNTRLYFNRCARTTVLPRPTRNGTPGARNSRFEPNIGPTFSGLKHEPVVPQPGEPVIASVAVQDPQGVAGCELRWSVNGGAWASAAMTAVGGGRYQGTIPGQAAGAIVQFYVRGVDRLGAAANYPPGGPDSGALYAVADGQADLRLGHNLRLILSPANRDLLHAFTNVMSNENLPATVIYDEKRAYYDAAIRLKGSERGRYSDTRVSFHVEFPPDDLFRGVHPVMLIDRSGAGDSTANKQMEIVIKHILYHAGHIPGPYSDLCRVIAPRSIHTGPAILSPRHEDEYIETTYPNGGDGTLWELELVYYPTTTNAYGYKNPQPDSVIGTDIQDLGDDKEIYRYNFIIKNHRDADDYAPFIRFAKTFSLSGTQLEQMTRQVMDVDEWMRVWALVTLCGVADSYTFGNNHNLLMYLRPTDRMMVAFPVDMDFSFYRAYNAALVGDQNLSRIINLTPNLRVFYAHILDIIGSTFNPSYMARWPDHYDNFCPGQNFTGALTYIQQRGDYAKSVIASAGGNAAFSVTTPTNFTTTSNLVTISGQAPVTVRTIKVNGQAYPVTWNTLSTWTMQVPLSEATNALVLTAYDVHGAPMAGLSRTVNVTYTGPVLQPEGTVVFNEIMYHPAAPEGSYLELLNTSTNFTFDLSGWRIDGLAFTFPSGSYIRPGQHLVLAKDVLAYRAAYGSNAPMPLATYTGVLRNDGETLTLLRPDPVTGQEVVVDRVRYESTPPWPPGANGTGSALQLIDPSQDRTRPANWFSDYRAAYTNYDWRMLSVTAAMGSVGRLLIYLTEPGEVYIDDLYLVVGTNAQQGPNLIRNGDFESPLVDDPPLTNSFSIGTNYTNSAISTEIKHSGNSSLRLVCTSPGTSTNRIIYQNISPPVPSGTICTLSFWYLPTTKATNLNIRIQSSSLMLATSVQPNFVPALIYATPGSNNVTPLGSLPPMPPLWLNEIQPENLTGIQDALGHRVPWIELYNASDSPQPLDGLFLSDNYSNLTQWAFPDGAVLGPREFKVIFADGMVGESSPTEWHTSFALSPGQGSVVLSWLVAGQARVLDYINYRAVWPDRSYGSYPDGQLLDRMEFYRPTPGAANDPTPAPLRVVINEWMAANTGTLLNTNNDNRYDDWFELYNPSAEPAPLQGYYLADDLGNRFQFAIPPGFVIPPGGFLLVWADNRPELNDPSRPELHVNFRLNQAGEQIGLFAPDGTLVDGVTFGPQWNDISEGRYPDGALARQFMAMPTPGGPNLPGNTPPSLAPIPNMTVGVGQAVRFTALATDPEAPPQRLTFSLDRDAPAGATIDPNTGQFFWLPPSPPPTEPIWITVRVTDNGTPPLSVTQTFAVQISPAPVVFNLGRLPDGQLGFSISVIPGKTYRLEYTDDLAGGLWQPLPPDYVASGPALNVVVPIDRVPQRFFRVRQLD